MKSYFEFLKENFEPVFFGWALTFFSVFGQTFLISLYVPFILTDLGFTKTEFGMYYAAATIISSILLLKFGYLIDIKPVRPITNRVILLLMAATFLFSISWGPIVFFIALIGLRFGGQGLMTHISMSVMSRHFDRDRGKALSLSSMGYSMSEMVFPFLFGIIIVYVGWRYTAGLGVVFLLFMYWVFSRMNIESLDLKSNDDIVLTIDRGQEKPMVIEKKEDDTSGRGKFFIEMLKESKFYILAIPTILLTFIVTGFFFYQFILADQRGWPITIYTLLFTGYGAVRVIFSLYGGILTDRYSASTLYVYHLLPMAMGTLSLALLPGLWAAAGFLFLFGVTVGLSGVAKPAVLAELYGIGRIGQVRSLYTSIMVVSTALAPLIFGSLLDSGVSFEFIAVICTIAMVAGSLHTFRIYSLKKPVSRTV